MDDSDTKKRPQLNVAVSDSFSNKKPKPQIDDIFSFSFSDLSFDHDELSQLLDTPFPCPVKFVSYPYMAPPLDYSTSFVTINGNDETCGSSFSDADSSIMAGFDTVAVNVGDPLAVWGAAWGETVSEVARGDTDTVDGDGDGGEWDWTELLFGDQVDKHRTN